MNKLKMEVKKLIEDFKYKNLPIHGNISLYGMYFGKPGDIFSKIKDISLENDVLIIDIGNKKIHLKYPKDITYNHYNFDIKEAESVYLNEKQYSFKENQNAFNLYDSASQIKGSLVK